MKEEGVDEQGNKLYRPYFSTDDATRVLKWT